MTENISYYRDLVNAPIAPLPFTPKEMRWMRWLYHLLQFPLFAPLVRKTFWGMLAQVAALRNQGSYNNALKLMVRYLQLAQSRLKPKQFWHLMHLAVNITQHQQLKYNTESISAINKLLEITKTLPRECNGYDAAYSLVGLGLWAFQFGRLMDARRLICLAIEADTSWGYSEYLMGWLGLFDKRINAVDHFVKAANRDWEALHRLKRDPVCQLHPEIYRQVRQKMLVNGHTVSFPSSP